MFMYHISLYLYYIEHVYIYTEIFYLLLKHIYIYTELFHMLLDAGADVHARYGVQSTELLHIAVDEGRLSEAQALVARGAAVGTVCSGRSALVAACQTQREGRRVFGTEGRIYRVYEGYCL